MDNPFPANISREWRESAPAMNPKRLSMSANSTKGLLNPAGENNCFLNCAVQVLWHLDVFRRSFRLLSGHACMGINSCIFCALKVLFTQFQYSDRSSLPPDSLRKALAKSFVDQHRFQMGFMDDAAECFENILMRIHFHLAHEEKEDKCQAKHCIPHEKFAMNIVEQMMCVCGAKSDPLPFSQMVYYVPASTLVAQAKTATQQNGNVQELFAQLVCNAVAEGDYRNCPKNCGRQVKIRRNLQNCPEVVSVGVIWDSDRPTISHITDVVKTIGTRVRLADLFNSSTDEGRISLHLVGVVCYYGRHYSAFFFHSKRQQWVYFDDATVKDMGPSWDNVAQKCCRGHYQPLLLLYANPNSQPISDETAPDRVINLPEHTKFSPQQEKKNNHTRQCSGGSKEYIAGDDQDSTPYYSYETSLSNDTMPGELHPHRQQQQQPRMLARTMDPPSTNIYGGYNSDEEYAPKSPSRRSGGGHTRQPSFLSAMDGEVLEQNGYAPEGRQNGHGHVDHRVNGYMDSREQSRQGNNYAHHKSVPDLTTMNGGNQSQYQQYNGYNQQQQPYNHQTEQRNGRQNSTQNEHHSNAPHGNAPIGRPASTQHGHSNGYGSVYEDHTRTMKPRPGSAPLKKPQDPQYNQTDSVENDQTYNKTTVLANDLQRNGYISHQEVQHRRSNDSVEQTRQRLSQTQISTGRDRKNSEEVYGPPIAVYNRKQNGHTLPGKSVNGRHSSMSQPGVTDIDCESSVPTVHSHNNQPNGHSQPTHHSQSNPPPSQDVVDGQQKKLHIVHDSGLAGPPPVVQDVKITPAKSGSGYKLKKRPTPAFSTFKSPDEGDFDPYRELPRDKKSHNKTLRKSKVQEPTQSMMTDVVDGGVRMEDDYEDWTLSNSAHNRRSSIPVNDSVSANNLGFVHNMAKNMSGKSAMPKGPSDVVRVQNDQSMENAYGPLEPAQYKGVTLPAHGGRHKSSGDQAPSMPTSRSQPEDLSKVSHVGSAYQAALKRAQSADESLDDRNNRPNVAPKPQIAPKPALMGQHSVDGVLDRDGYSSNIRDAMQKNQHVQRMTSFGGPVQRMTSDGSSGSSGYRTGSSNDGSNYSESPSGSNYSNKFQYDNFPHSQSMDNLSSRPPSTTHGDGSAGDGSVDDISYNADQLLKQSHDAERNSNLGAAISLCSQAMGLLDHARVIIPDHHKTPAMTVSLDNRYTSAVQRSKLLQQKKDEATYRSSTPAYNKPAPPVRQISAYPLANQQPSNKTPDPEPWSGTKTAEIYGTLPKKGKTHYSNIGNQPSVYQTFLDKQRAGAVNVKEQTGNHSNKTSKDNVVSHSRQASSSSTDYVSNEFLQNRRRCDSESSVMGACEEEVIGSTNQGTIGYNHGYNNRVQREHSADSVYSYQSQRSSTSSSASASTSSTLDGRKAAINNDTYTKQSRGQGVDNVSSQSDHRNSRKDTRLTNHSRDSSCSSSHTLTAHSRENSLSSVLSSNKVRRSTTPTATQHYLPGEEYREATEYVSCQRQAYPGQQRQNHGQPQTQNNHAQSQHESQSQKPWYGDDDEFPPPPPPIANIEAEQPYDGQQQGQFQYQDLSHLGRKHDVRKSASYNQLNSYEQGDKIHSYHNGTNDVEFMTHRDLKSNAQRLNNHGQPPMERNESQSTYGHQVYRQHPSNGPQHNAGHHPNGPHQHMGPNGPHHHPEHNGSHYNNTNVQNSVNNYQGGNNRQPSMNGQHANGQPFGHPQGPSHPPHPTQAAPPHGHPSQQNSDMDSGVCTTPERTRSRSATRPGGRHRREHGAAKHRSKSANRAISSNCSVTSSSSSSSHGSNRPGREKHRQGIIKVKMPDRMQVSGHADSVSLTSSLSNDSRNTNRTTSSSGSLSGADSVSLNSAGSSSVHSTGSDNSNYSYGPRRTCHAAKPALVDQSKGKRRKSLHKKSVSFSSHIALISSVQEQQPEEHIDYMAYVKSVIQKKPPPTRLYMEEPEDDATRTPAPRPATPTAQRKSFPGAAQDGSVEYDSDYTSESASEEGNNSRHPHAVGGGGGGRHPRTGDQHFYGDAQTDHQQSSAPVEHLFQQMGPGYQSNRAPSGPSVPSAASHQPTRGSHTRTPTTPHQPTNQHQVFMGVQSSHMCQLCHSKSPNGPGSQYCTDCSSYMKPLTSKTHRTLSTDT